MSSIET